MMTLNCNIQMLVKVSNKTLIIWCTLVRKELKELLFPLSFFFSYAKKIGEKKQYVVIHYVILFEQLQRK